MNILDARQDYIPALLFGADTVDAVTRPGHGEHGVSRLRDPLHQELDRVRHNWDWCDNPMDVDLVATGALRAVTQYCALRRASALILPGQAPLLLWPAADLRLAALAEALEFAGHCAEQAWRHSLDEPLRHWWRDRLATLLAPVAAGENTRALADRVQRALVLCDRYRVLRHEIFRSRHSVRPGEADWLSPEPDLVVKAPFDGYAHGDRPEFLLRLLPAPAGVRAVADFAVANGTIRAQTYRITVSEVDIGVPAELIGDANCLIELRSALLAAGVAVPPGPPMPDGPCPHHRDRGR
ncbi:hypothetical protein Cs7R123_67260 [Catellatospora sp. TT07R-123]|uniref:hypothetical protein n=1 Tax=Catellatospora sp. TT07R-123 TaxID=2733863 RepID=UPI001B12BF54|nr:hypothetical protein [Catellatospora sp. TT07R-123]GHJ49384.1 hypothetical protein Cs7R123_67260 [Catellatospora sp. TT07R-123]